mmetsp:Transcript_28710/g.72708  ORF Transcript_28710/g.72708 Transcript_28710/m.72708 type:complete len:367 (-) Transcript_28710:2881-3981(-)
MWSIEAVFILSILSSIVICCEEAVSESCSEAMFCSPAAAASTGCGWLPLRALPSALPSALPPSTESAATLEPPILSATNSFLRSSIAFSSFAMFSRINFRSSSNFFSSSSCCFRISFSICRFRSISCCSLCFRCWFSLASSCASAFWYCITSQKLAEACAAIAIPERFSASFSSMTLWLAPSRCGCRVDCSRDASAAGTSPDLGDRDDVRGETPAFFTPISASATLESISVLIGFGCAAAAAPALPPPTPAAGLDSGGLALLPVVLSVVPVVPDIDSSIPDISFDEPVPLDIDIEPDRWSLLPEPRTQSAPNLIPLARIVSRPCSILFNNFSNLSFSCFRFSRICSSLRLAIMAFSRSFSSSSCHL